MRYAQADDINQSKKLMKVDLFPVSLLFIKIVVTLDFSILTQFTT